MSGSAFFQAQAADQAPCARTIVAMLIASPLASGSVRCYYEALAMPDTSTLALTTLALGDAPVGFRGRIIALDVNQVGAGLPAAELERRLLELGFVEGAAVGLLHQGLFGGDPIAVRVADTTIALRRREAMAVIVAPRDAMP